MVVFVGFVIFMASQKPSKPATDYSKYELSVIQNLAKQPSYDSVDRNQIIPASEDSGGIEENVKGSPETADVIIYEYADYQCSHCAVKNTEINKILADNPGKVALVFRTYILPYHEQSVVASSAAEAAALQGYWAEFKDLLFGNQAEWANLETDERIKQMEEYFQTASGEKGDLEKFRTDMKSEAVAKKLAYDMGLGNSIPLEGTPTFYIDGEFVSVSDLQNTIKEKLSQ